MKDYERYRLSWHIPYTPGTLTAVGYDADGKEIARDEVKTAGAPAALRLTAVKDKIAADGESVTLVYCSAVDADGIVCPNAAIPVTFAVSGSGTLAATDNGDPRDTVGFASPIRTTLSGVAAAFVRAGNEAGSITLTASADGLKGAEIAITAE